MKWTVLAILVFTIVLLFILMKLRPDVLRITHNSGFFSCCSVRLHEIVKYYNTNKKLPNVDSSVQFDWYKTDKNEDITNKYFKDYNEVNITEFDSLIDYDENYQYKDFRTLDHASIAPFITKYFSPSDDVNRIIREMEQKYNIDPDNTLVLFYRGNDKSTETILPKYEDYITRANNLISANPNLKILIQSDETEFIDTMTAAFPTSFYFSDEIRHMKKSNTTVDKVSRNNVLEFSQKYLAITIIMSKCKYIIFGSGNCSIWITLYRKNADNVTQFLNGAWLDS